jgi:hypothetical protein
MNEIQKVDQQAKSEVVPQEVNQSVEQLKTIKEFISKAMVENVDYGVIPHCQKPSLFKSGAEKIQFYLNLFPTYTEIERITEPKLGFFFYRYKCEVYSKITGKKVGEAIGSANTKEKKFATQEPYSILNTIDKMAQKRAYVSAILNSGRGIASESFTCDIEDMEIQPEKQEVKKIIPSTPGFTCSDCDVSISVKVAEYSKKKYGEYLCMKCQQKTKDAIVPNDSNEGEFFSDELE